MNFEFVNFLNAQAEDNEELRLVLEKLEKEIIKYNQLRAEDLALDAEEFDLQMTNRMLQSIADNMQEHCEQDKIEEQAISELYGTFKELPLRRIDMNEVVRNHIELQEMKWQNEKKELDEEHRQRKEMLERLENRNIVKKLRQTQKEHQEALQRKQEAEAQKEIQLKEIRQKLRDAEKKRNDLILSMVIESKNLETVRREKMYSLQQSEQLQKLEDKRNELRKKLQQRKQNEQICTDMPTTSSIVSEKVAQNMQQQESSNLLEDLPTFDPSNPMAFLNSLNLDINTNKILQEFSLALQKKQLPKEVPEEKTTELRSILRNKTDANDGKESEYIKSTEHHVHFLESDSSNDGVSSSSTTSSCLDCAEAGTNNLPNSSIQEMTTDDAEIIDLLTPADKKHENDVVIPETYTEISENTIEIPQNTAKISENDVEVPTKSLSPVAQVLECKIIKPAGTALPKSIPFTLSPLSSEISANENLDTVAVTSFKKFRIPQPPKASQQSTSFKSKDDIDSKPTLTKKSQASSSCEQSFKKENLDLSFESLYLSNNIQSSSESEDDLGFEAVADSNTDNFVFDFSNSDENKNDENSDTNPLDFHFNDSFAGKQNARKNSFDL